MPLLAIILVLLVLLPIGLLIWRFKRDDEAVGGGSYGEQVGRGGDDDWGPHSDPPPPPPPS